MNNKHSIAKSDPTSPLRQLDLIPPHFRSMRQAKRAVLLWAATLFALLMILFRLGILHWQETREQIERDDQLLASAESVKELRRSVLRIESDNRRQSQWVQWVQSAKPDDSLLQTLATITAATGPETEVVENRPLEIQRVSIKLPVEYPPQSPVLPTWAEARLRVLAVAKSRQQAIQWSDRLSDHPRLQSIEISTPPGVWEDAVAQLSGKPVSTRMVP